MSNNLRSNIPNLLLLVRPDYFEFNRETADSNSYQQKTINPSLSGKVMKEFEALLTVLEANNIAHKVFKSLPDTPDAVFPNNWITTSPIGRITLYPMLAKNRRAEIRSTIIEWVRKAINAVELIDLRSELEKDRILEGTGSIVFDHFQRKAYACESPRTNISLFEEYCDRIGYTPISFESLNLRGEQIYHTNVMMTIAKHYCLINLASIENPMERAMCKLELEKGGRTIIPVSHSQMANFACNALEVLDKKGNSCLIISTSALNSLTQDQKVVIERHSKIISSDVSSIEQIGGGGIRCMLAGFYK